MSDAKDAKRKERSSNVTTVNHFSSFASTVTQLSIPCLLRPITKGISFTSLMFPKGTPLLKSVLAIHRTEKRVLTCFQMQMNKMKELISEASTWVQWTLKGTPIKEQPPVPMFIRATPQIYLLLTHPPPMKWSSFQIGIYSQRTMLTK